jgi:hypothetical protein
MLWKLMASAMGPGRLFVNFRGNIPVAGSAGRFSVFDSWTECDAVNMQVYFCR